MGPLPEDTIGGGVGPSGLTLPAKAMAAPVAAIKARMRMKDFRRGRFMVWLLSFGRYGMQENSLRVRLLFSVQIGWSSIQTTAKCPGDIFAKLLL
jgi:hypothetical protein